MKTGMLTAAIAAVVLVTSPALAAQATQNPNCGPGQKGAVKTSAPAKVEGQVTKVDPASDMITVKASDGQEHQFRVSKDEIQNYKVGDKIEAKLRAQPCS